MWFLKGEINMKRKILSFVTMLAMIANMFAAIPVTYAANSEMLEPKSNASVLDGKKILFAGCSYTYYGGTVLANAVTRTYEERLNDPGFFYQLCKANGAEVSVTDWTFGAHSLRNMFGGTECTNSNCTKNPINHLETLKDRKYDYVVIQDVVYKASESELDKTDYEAKINLYVDTVKKVMELFRAENPDVKFYYGIYTGMYTNEKSFTEALPQSLERIKDLGVTMIDVGTLAYDVINGVTQVPGAEMEYNDHSFLVGTDNYHQNILSGYLYALMTYCAITGETAVGQPYSFCYDENDEAYPAGKSLKLETYIEKYYTPKEATTNFPEIFASEADMKGLQQLANEYIDQNKEPWKKWLHTVTLNENGGTDAEDATILHNHTVYEDLPDNLTRDGYAFKGWYKDEALTIPLEETDTVTEDITLYAAWGEPEIDVTRAMFVSALYENEDNPPVNRSIPFADVDMSADYANAVVWAQQNGIVNGISETEFNPNGNITREQLAAIMHRYAQSKGYDVSAGESTSLLGYTDADKVSEYAIIPMQYAVGSGLINGNTDLTLNPLGNTTITEMEAILERFIEVNKQ